MSLEEFMVGERELLERFYYFYKTESKANATEFPTELDSIWEWLEQYQTFSDNCR